MRDARSVARYVSACAGQQGWRAHSDELKRFNPSSRVDEVAQNSAHDGYQPQHTQGVVHGTLPPLRSHNDLRGGTFSRALLAEMVTWRKARSLQCDFD